MEPFLLKLAGLTIQVTPVTERLSLLMKSYVVTEGTPDFCVELSPDDMKEESERLALQRKIAERFLDYDVLLFHSSMMAVDGFGYAYSAPSGTGKSTHTRLLREVYGSRVVPINDDKPFVKVGEKAVYGYGSPWDGKEHLNTNTSVILHGLCFIHQAAENEIHSIEPFDAFMHLMQQVYVPKKKELAEKAMALIEKMATLVPAYEMGCNISEDAARMSYQAMGRVKFEDVLLRDGEITYRTKGISMEPMLHENKDVVIIQALGDRELKKYDVVLFKRPTSDDIYVLHRILRVKSDGYDIVGDNQYVVEKNVKREQILGILTSYIHDGKEISSEDKKYLRYVHLWCDFFPIRAALFWVRAKWHGLMRRVKKLFGKKNVG